VSAHHRYRTGMRFCRRIGGIRGAICDCHGPGRTDLDNPHHYDVGDGCRVNETSQRGAVGGSPRHRAGMDHHDSGGGPRRGRQLRHSAYGRLLAATKRPLYTTWSKACNVTESHTLRGLSMSESDTQSTRVMTQRRTGITRWHKVLACLEWTADDRIRVSDLDAD